MPSKKADASQICTFVDDCVGPDLLEPTRQVSCHGLVQRSAFDAKSFGVPFTTHAMLCDGHRTALRYYVAK